MKGRGNFVLVTGQPGRGGPDESEPNPSRTCTGFLKYFLNLLKTRLNIYQTCPIRDKAGLKGYPK